MNTDLDTVTKEHLDELRRDPNVESIHVCRMLQDTETYRVYDLSMEIDGTVTEGAPILLMEVDDPMLLTAHADGSMFIHFLSLTPGLFHYKAEVKSSQIEIMEEVK